MRQRVLSTALTAKIVSVDKDEQVPNKYSADIRKRIALALACADTHERRPILICRFNRTNKFERIGKLPNEEDGTVDKQHANNNCCRSRKKMRVGVFSLQSARL